MEQQEDVIEDDNINIVRVGERENSFKYFYRGFLYHKESSMRNPQFQIYRCGLRSINHCSGTLRFNTITGQIEEVTPHFTHGPNNLILPLARLKPELKREALNGRGSISLRRIFDEVCVRYPAEVARLLSYNSVRTTMYERMILNRGPVPEELEAFGIALEGMNLESTEGMFRGIIRGTDDSIALLFASEAIIRAFNAGTDFSMDGTYDIVPARPTILQLYTVHVRYADIIFPVFWALRTRKTKQMYIAIWTKILELAPGIRKRNISILGDFEAAAHSAVFELIANIILRGCWFHYLQALFRKWISLGLLQAPRDALWMAMGLPLLPAEHFGPGVAIIQNVADDVVQNHPGILLFVAYLRMYWLPRANIACVYRCPIRTNNELEAFHRQFPQKFGGPRRNVFTFLEKVKLCTNGQELDLERLQMGHDIRRPRKSQSTLDDIHIIQRQDQFDLGRIGLEEFLRTAVSYRRRQDYENQLNIPEIQNFPCEDADLVPSNILHANNIVPDLNAIRDRTLRQEGNAIQEPAAVNIIQGEQEQGEQAQFVEDAQRGLGQRGVIRGRGQQRGIRRGWGRGRGRGRGQGQQPGLGRLGNAGGQRGLRHPRGRGVQRGPGRPRGRQQRGPGRPRRQNQPGNEEEAVRDINNVNGQAMEVDAALPRPENPGIGNEVHHWQQNEEVGQAPICCICLVNNSNHLGMPCSHLCMCLDCSIFYEYPRCSVCREPMERVHRIFY